MKIILELLKMKIILVTVMEKPKPTKKVTLIAESTVKQSESEFLCIFTIAGVTLSRSTKHAV